MGYIEQAKWITAGREGTRMPVFGIDLMASEKLAHAKIEICGLGQFALFVSGKEVNEGVYEPGWTDYRKTCLYSRYDLVEYLKPGENRIRVMLGNGMYHEEGGRYAKFTESMGDPLLIAALHLIYEDGREEVRITDESWSVCAGPVLFSSIYGGEDYDGREDGWMKQIAEERGWKNSSLYSGTIGKLKEAFQPPVQVQNELAVQERKKISDGSFLMDFGRNFAGRVRIRVRGQRGETVKITPGELLDAEEKINQEFTGAPHYYVYTLSGNETETWAPRFTFYGQRYAVVETAAELLEITGLEQYASCPQTGSFRCSNEMYNRIHELILGAVRSNMQSVFTDCPHREKLGWLEENHLIGPGILYDYNALALYEKILDDMEDAQTPEGLVPSICPEYVQFEMGFRDSPEWGSACVLLPWYLYQRYGKTELLSRHYAMGARYVSYLLSKRKGGILNYGLGDWLDVGHYPLHPANTPIPVTATAILYQDLCVLGKVAAVLGRTDDAEMYKKQAEECRRAFNEVFFYPLPHTYATGSQTANAMALYLDIPDKGEREPVLQNLIDDILMRGNHFTGGDVGHPYILRALGKCGRSDIVAQNLTRTDFPSYGYQVACGATTLCEDWDGPNPEHPVMSQNHFMLGGAEEWFYRYLAGIRPDASAEERIRIEPCFPDEVEWVECKTLTVAGICQVRWKKEDESIFVEVEVEKPEQILLCLNGKEESIRVEGRVERRLEMRKNKNGQLYG
ncbi:MAG: family 78 glycoside hydrolase catalytic domain [Lachnospiraceae bacterium]|nr:family 78 glycoside hydrolase catalytic domain [Lachnospiraceae bacterium]